MGRPDIETGFEVTCRITNFAFGEVFFCNVRVCGCERLRQVGEIELTPCGSVIVSNNGEKDDQMKFLHITRNKHSGQMALVTYWARTSCTES